MKPRKLLFSLIASALLLSGASESGEMPRSAPKKIRVEHEKATKNVQDLTKEQPKEPTAFQTQAIEALRAIAEQQKAANQQNDPNRKPIDWIQIGLLVAAALYTFFAWRQWRAVGRLVEQGVFICSAVYD